ncbi:uncharacterized protein LOC131892197 [Tigriopus californicus]|uniref:uncharacterized protein LOC131892197 n=1 Tax=Tigriopus californicus TaxID=6832 RepID=UPI0027DA0D49|nr:uncharacterized protein LOC131892197 [Tigriopus californicus]
MNSGNTYARLMKIVVRELVDQKKCLSYFDDHLIPAESFLQALFRFAEFLHAVERANLKVGPSKTELFTEEAVWLGHLVKPGGLTPAERLTEASHCRAYEETPIRDTEFEWTDKQQAAFQQLKQKLCEKPVLAHPNFQGNRPFILDTDASGFATGAVLSQKQANGTVRPVAYTSKSLTHAEKNYSVTRKELLAILQGVKHFRYFLLGRKFLVRTDHMALKWLMTSMSLRVQLLRWREELQDYDFQIEHRPGANHGNADALSRRPVSEENPAPDIEIIPEDHQMYQALEVKPPSTGDFRKAHVNAVTRSRAKRMPPLDEEIEDEITPCPGIDSRPSDQDPGEPNQNLDDNSISHPADWTNQNSPNSTCFCEDQNPNDNVNHQLVLQDEAEGHAWNDEDRPNPKLTAQMTKSNVPVEQTNDRTLNQVRNWLVQPSQVPPISALGEPKLQQYRAQLDKLTLKNDKLYLTTDNQERVYIPDSIIPDLLRCLHHHPLAGHQGRASTYRQARRHFYWPGTAKDISSIIEGCAPCQLAKRRTHEKHVPLGQTSTAIDTQFTHFYADIVGPWPGSQGPQGKRYLLTIQDAFTKYPEAWSINAMTTETILRILTNEFFPRFGVGMKIITDQGRQFVSALFKTSCRRLGVIKSQTMAYEPHTNPVEHLHRSLEGTIRALM